MARKIKKHKHKTQIELLKSIRKPSAPPSRRFKDRKKAANKKACRGRYRGE